MTDNPFERLWALGYKTLVPIIPPGAPISAMSSLYKRVGTHQDGRGKVPGVKGSDGNWFSFNWLPHETDEDDLRRWAAMVAGVGIRTGPLGDGTTLVGGDADAPEEARALIIRDVFRKHLGSMMPIRVGRLPKALYLFRVRGDYTYRRLDFGPRDDRGNILYRVEMLSQGQQFVAHGVHPKTMQPYSWPKPLVAVHDLPIFEPEQVDAALQEMASLLPQAVPKLTKTGGEGDVNQAALRGDLEAVRRAVAATPNTTAAFPTREAYRDFGYAIKAALPDHTDEAFDIYARWCDRWQDEHGRTNDPDIYEADWRRMKPPFRIGAGYVFEKAERLSGGAFTRGDVWFDFVPEADRGETIFDMVRSDEDGGDQEIVLPFKPWSRMDLSTIPAPAFVYSDFYARGYSSLTVAAPKIGKSMLGLAEAVDMASGRGFLTGKPQAPLKVVYYNAEDDQDVINSRVAALLTAYGIDQSEIEGRLFATSGVTQEKFFLSAGPDPEINEPLFQALEKFILEEGIDVLIFDPLQDMTRSPETNDVFRALGQRLRRLASATGVAIGVIHHTRKMTAGVVATIDDARGGGALRGTARFNRILVGMTAEEAAKAGVENHRHYLRIGDAESNLAPPSSEVNRWFEKASVVTPNGHSVGVIKPWEWPDAMDGYAEFEAAVLRALDEGLPSGERYSDRAQDKDRWAGAVIMEKAKASGRPRTEDQVKIILKTWITDGTLETREYHSPTQHKRRKGLYVTKRPASAIFD